MSVQFSSAVRQHGEEQIQEDGLDDEEQCSVVIQPSEVHVQGKVQVGRTSWIRVFQVSLGAFYLLLLIGLFTRYVLLSFANNSWMVRDAQLRANLSGCEDNLQKKPGNRVEKVKATLCPDRWLLFEGSCYFKSTEGKNWLESRRDCQDQRADLVVINSKEEHEFVVEMSGVDEVWIGLYHKQPSGDELYSLWKWVDGSPLTLQFWSEGFPSNDTVLSRASCCNGFKKWTHLFYVNDRKWICEK